LVDGGFARAGGEGGEEGIEGGDAVGHGKRGILISGGEVAALGGEIVRGGAGGCQEDEEKQ